MHLESSYKGRLFCLIMFLSFEREFGFILTLKYPRMVINMNGIDLRENIAKLRKQKFTLTCQS